MRYIGSKTALLQEIDEVVRENVPQTASSILDLFGGTNAIGRHFKSRFEVISNDLLYFSFVNAKATIENNVLPSFKKLAELGIDDPFLFLGEQAAKYVESEITGYYELSYSPSGGAGYLTTDNAKRIDYIRDQIEDWSLTGAIEPSEYFYLLSSLIEAIPSVSNTTGTYGAYLKHWDKRALNQLELVPLKVLDNRRANKSYNCDAVRLASDVVTDVVYIDTPYNSRQYAANYHLLENIAKNEKPAVSGKTKLFPWQDLKSDFSVKSKAISAMSELFSNLKAEYVVLSYNNEGIISEKALLDLISEHSRPDSLIVKRIPYRKYRSKVPSRQENLYELLIFYRNRNSQLAVDTFSSEGVPVTAVEVDTTSKQDAWIGQKSKLVKAPINYIGGKFRLLKQILPLFPGQIDTFVDIFCGGANVGINVQAKRHLFNDMNSKVIELLEYFSESDPEKLVEQIQKTISLKGLSKTNEESFQSFRTEYNQNPNPLDLYILSSFSYNYQFRFNNAMQFNNPFGRNRSHFSPNMEKNLVEFVNRLRSLDARFTDFYFQDFDFDQLTSMDFVYLDPPYLITTGSYNDGNRGFRNWSSETETEMYSLLDDLTKRRIRWALSNVLTHKGKTNELLQQFIADRNVTVKQLAFNYDNASYNSKEKGSSEVLITNYDFDSFQIRH